MHWALRPVLGDALAFNVIYLSAWVVCSWCTYLLARRVVEHWGAAFVAALAFTYSSVRLAHHGHFQLVVGGAFGTARAPAAVAPAGIAVHRPRDRARCRVLGHGPHRELLRGDDGGRPRRGRGRMVHHPTPMAGARAARRTRDRRGGRVGARGADQRAVPAHPARPRSSGTPSIPTMAARLGDFLAAGSPNHLVHWFPVIGTASSPTRDLEHRLFPGLVALVPRRVRRVRDRTRGSRAGRARGTRPGARDHRRRGRIGDDLRLRRLVPDRRPAHLAAVRAPSPRRARIRRHPRGVPVCDPRRARAGAVRRGRPRPDSAAGRARRAGR